MSWSSITTTNICGSDLHMYEGRTDFEAGTVLGHENLGEVVRGRRRGRQGQGRGHGLRALQHQLRTLPELRARSDRLLPDGPTEPGMAGAAYGFAEMGPWRRAGRVPARAVGRLQLPAPARGRPGEGGRLRHALRHLPHRMARHRDGRPAARRVHRRLRRRPGRADGRALGRHPRAPAR